MTTLCKISPVPVIAIETGLIFPAATALPVLSHQVAASGKLKDDIAGPIPWNIRISLLSDGNELPSGSASPPSGEVPGGIGNGNYRKDVIERLKSIAQAGNELLAKPLDSTDHLEVVDAAYELAKTVDELTLEFVPGNYPPDIAATSLEAVRPLIEIIDDFRRKLADILPTHIEIDEYLPMYVMRPLLAKLAFVHDLYARHGLYAKAVVKLAAKDRMARAYLAAAYFHLKDISDKYNRLGLDPKYSHRMLSFAKLVSSRHEFPTSAYGAFDWIENRIRDAVRQIVNKVHIGDDVLTVDHLRHYESVRAYESFLEDMTRGGTDGLRIWDFSRSILQRWGWDSLAKEHRIRSIEENRIEQKIHLIGTREALEALGFGLVKIPPR